MTKLRRICNDLMTMLWFFENRAPGLSGSNCKGAVQRYWLSTLLSSS